MSLNFNAQYQYRLTRHLNKLQHLSKQTQAYIYDLTLKNVLINSHFANDTSTALMFLNNGLIFVNGQQYTWATGDELASPARFAQFVQLVTAETTE